MAMRGAMLANAAIFVFGFCMSHAFIPALVFTTKSANPDFVHGQRITQRPSATLPLQQQQQQQQERAEDVEQTRRAEQAPEGSLVLIEVTKKGARVFKSVAKGSEAFVVEPVDEWRVHETGNREKRSQGQGKHHAEKADPMAEESYLVKFYMDELSEVIDAADSVLLVGHGNAKSNIAEVLAAALCERQPSRTDKIADVLRVDGKHITQNQLLKLGRRHLLHTDDPRTPT